jgi:tetratricopeptide (TPR) repeat protein
MRGSMRRPTCVLLFLLVAGLRPAISASAQDRLIPADIPGQNPIQSFFSGWHVIYAHVKATTGVGDTVGPTRPAGVVQPFPNPQSPRHQGLLVLARELYGQGRFVEAIRTIRPAVLDEPDNPFVLNEYARALFQVDSLRPAARQQYERLEALLVKVQTPDSNTVVIDMWFPDVYWKLGMLYLDVGNYKSAYLELAKVALTNPSSSILREQLYGYLAEAAFYLGEQQTADWFISKTLELNPANQYVLQFRAPR